MKPTVSIIGAGKFGQTLARLLADGGYTIQSVHSKTRANAAQLARHVGAQVVNNIRDIRADCILLTVPDDAIQPIAETLAQDDLTGIAVIHTSGAAGIDRLSSAKAAGARVGSLHPAFPFADVETALQTITGATVAIETDDDTLRDQLLAMVATIGGVPLHIPAGKKAQYHAALVIASNYTVTLYAIARDLLAQLGAADAVAENALNRLVVATVNNIAQQGIPDALTGPLVRADVGTIRAHMATFTDADLRTLYTNLARASYPMLRERGIDPNLIETAIQDLDG